MQSVTEAEDDFAEEPLTQNGKYIKWVFCQAITYYFLITYSLLI